MSTVDKVKIKCPYCDEIFSCLIQMSYSIFSQYLDFKPSGAAIIPDPLPKCPECGFTFYEGQFTKEEINKLKDIFSNNNIFKLEPNMPNYYYLAKEFELLNKNIDHIINLYQSAIWENGKKNDSFVKITDIIMEYFSNIDASNKNYYNYVIIKLDLLRRRGEFEKAKQLINEINNDKDFPISDGIKILLEYQEELIDKNDIDEHIWPKENKKERDRRAFFNEIKISITIGNSKIDKHIFEELNKIILIKSTKLFAKINSHLPIVEGSIYSEIINKTINYLRDQNIDTTINISNKTITKSMNLAELNGIIFNAENNENIENMIFKMFNI